MRAFRDGAGAFAIAGAAVPLALTETWEVSMLAAAVTLFVRRGVLLTLIGAGGAGALATTLGASLPS